MRAEIGDCIQDLCSKALFTKGSFSRNVGNVLSGLKKTITVYQKLLTKRPNNKI